jgi:hypothetical protein
VLFDFHHKDTDYAIQVLPYFTGKGCVPLIFQETDEPANNLEDFHNKPGQSSVMIIFFGNVEKKWVEKRIETAVQYVSANFSLKNKKSFQVIGLYLFPPPAPDKTQGFDFPEFFKIMALDNSCKSDFYPQVLKPLFECARWDV